MTVERVHHRRPEILALDREQLADGLGFGFQPLHAALGGGERRTRGVDFFARAADARLRRLRGGFGFGERRLRFGKRGASAGKIGLRRCRSRRGRPRYW